MASVYFLEWDDENEEHLAQHDIAPSEVRQLLGNRHITRPNPKVEGRMLLIGLTNGGRGLVVSLEPTRDLGTWRPVTGWPAEPKDLRLLDR